MNPSLGSPRPQDQLYRPSRSLIASTYNMYTPPQQPLERERERERVVLSPSPSPTPTNSLRRSLTPSSPRAILGQMRLRQGPPPSSPKVSLSPRSIEDVVKRLAPPKEPWHLATGKEPQKFETTLRPSKNTAEYSRQRRSVQQRSVATEANSNSQFFHLLETGGGGSKKPFPALPPKKDYSQQPSSIERHTDGEKRMAKMAMEIQSSLVGRTESF